MTQAPLLFLLFLRQIISHRCRVCRGNPGPPTFGEHPEQRPRPLFSAVSGNISASFDGILMATTISNLKRFVNLTHAVCASI
jgi:hypothetical protein